MPHPIQLDQILLFGDSITQRSFDPFEMGFGANLSNIYVRKLDVVNRGFSGYNTTWCAELLPHVLKTTLPCPQNNHYPSIKLITVFLGANDSVLEGNRQYVSLNDYKKNLNKMIDMIHENDLNTRVLMITPPPVDPHRWAAHKGVVIPDRSVSNTKLYVSACLEIGFERSIPVLDTWKLFLGDKECTPETTKEILIDGLHLASKGNKILAGGIMECVKCLWPEILPDQLLAPVAWHDKRLERTMNDERAGRRQTRTSAQKKRHNCNHPIMKILIWILLLIQSISSNDLKMQRAAKEITSHFLEAAKRDMTPSLLWAAIQVESLFPLHLSESTAINKIPLSIQSALLEYGVIVLKELQPGLSQAVIHLIQNHTQSSDSPKLGFTKLELSDFVAELSDNWSGALKRSLNIWIEHRFDSLLGYFAKFLGSVGRDLILKLGKALNNFKNKSMYQTIENNDLYSNIKIASKDVASASLTFLHGSGWMTREMNACLVILNESAESNLLRYDFE